MSLLPHTIQRPAQSEIPLVLDSPHSGRIYPADFNFICPQILLRQTEDAFVDELVSGAVGLGATLIAAEFPRSYIDANRAEDDLDPALLAAPWPHTLNASENTLKGLGLVRRLVKSNLAIYQAPLPVAEVGARITNFYRPYHKALQETLDKHHAHFGRAILINCHSMPNRSAMGDKEWPDFVLGDRDGTSCNPRMIKTAHDILQGMGFSVALNDPFKGVEIVRRHGIPHQKRHAMQLEINRRLYMDEETVQKHSGFDAARTTLTQFFAAFIEEMELSAEPTSLAAE